MGSHVKAPSGQTMQDWVPDCSLRETAPGPQTLRATLAECGLSSWPGEEADPGQVRGRRPTLAMRSCIRALRSSPLPRAWTLASRYLFSLCCRASSTVWGSVGTPGGGRSMSASCSLQPQSPSPGPGLILPGLTGVSGAITGCTRSTAGDTLEGAVGALEACGRDFRSGEPRIEMQMMLSGQYQP